MTRAAQPLLQGPARVQCGFSLVELMVAMAIGLFLLATLGYVFLGARTSFSTLDALSRMQENARFAFETMATDIRMAGFTGGPFDGGTPVNVVNSPGGSWDPNLMNLYGAPLFGYEEGGTFPIGVTGRTGLTGDALTVVRADTETEYTLSAHDEDQGAIPPTHSFTIDFGTCPTSDLPQAGQILVAGDYTHSAVFQAKTVTTCGSGTMDVGYGAGTSPSPGNSVAVLGPFNGDIGARKLYRLRGATYFIATNAGGEPALYRLELDADGGGATAKEVLEGVENMQIEYGVDVNTPPQNVTNYHAANNSYFTSDPSHWSNVLSVRITLTLVSRATTRVTATGDGLMRKTLTNTIAVRNRLL